MNSHIKNITNTRWTPQEHICGYILVSAPIGTGTKVLANTLASSRDVSNMILQ